METTLWMEVHDSKYESMHISSYMATAASSESRKFQVNHSVNGWTQDIQDLCKASISGSRLCKIANYRSTSLTWHGAFAFRHLGQWTNHWFIHKGDNFVYALCFLCFCTYVCCVHARWVWQQFLVSICTNFGWTSTHFWSNKLPEGSPEIRPGTSSAERVHLGRVWPLHAADLAQLEDG